MPNDEVPVAVIIPTYGRKLAVISVLQKIQQCHPRPAEIWIHIDQSDGKLELELKRRFPNVGVLTSLQRLGPGGGRHQCLLNCLSPYIASFDDDSYPVDADFFLQVVRLFQERPQAAVFGATIWHRNEPQKTRNTGIVRRPSFVGCGHAIRLAAYRQVRGYLSSPIPYGMEESDLSLQLFVSGWQVFEAECLRVFHDTDLKHHRSPEIVSATIANVGLYAFLHYPIAGLGRALLQLANKVAYCIRVGRLRGIGSGLARIPFVCFHYRQFRNPLNWKTVKRFLDFDKEENAERELIS